MAGLGSTARRLVAEAVSRSGLYAALRRPLGRARGGFVLAYHNLPVARFVEQITALAPSRPVPLDELVSRHARGAPTADLFAITFDDGVGETVREIAAVAKARQWPVSFYLPTAYLDQAGGMPFQWLRAIERHAPPLVLQLSDGPVDFRAPGAARDFAKAMTRIMYARPWAEYGPRLQAIATALVEQGAVDAQVLAAPSAITWAEVEALARDSVLSFESHGVSHTALAALTPEQAEQELVTSQRAIAERTGRPCRHFCYPYGGPVSIGDAAPALVGRLYASGTTMSRGRLGRHAPALLPRVPVYPHDDALLVRLKVLTA